ncbi:MAG: PAS domain-containing protein [Thalassobaculaceae bacterium]|nr:PAS domain-containing protein [Thalassobaculaceae bacterium]
MLNPMPQLQWLLTDPSNDLQFERLRDLFSLWTARCHGDRLPTRGDFSSEELMSFAGRVVLIDVERAPFRLKWRLIGAYITEVVGRDSTGRYLDEVHLSEHYDLLSLHFQRVIDERIPLRMYGKLVYADKPQLLAESIDMPLQDDDGVVTMILRGLDFAT